MSSSSSQFEDTTTILITGVTGSVGQGIFSVNLGLHSKLKVYGTSRSLKSAQTFFTTFMDTNPWLISRVQAGSLNFQPVALDMEDFNSINRFANQLVIQKEKLDKVYCNAGAIVSQRIDWVQLLYQFVFDIQTFAVNPNYIVFDRTQVDNLGLEKSFKTNVLGHYLLVDALTPVLKRSGKSKVVWTSSSEAKSEFFDGKDVQGIQSVNPYGSNKFCITILNQYLNTKYKEDNLMIRSVLFNPGVLPSAIATSLVPPFLVSLAMVPLFLLLRFFFGVYAITMTGANACRCLKDVEGFTFENLDKYTFASQCDRIGTPKGKVTRLVQVDESLMHTTMEQVEGMKQKVQEHWD